MATDFLRRKRSRLSLPEWKTDPWSELTKTPKDVLLDILIEFPGLIEQFDIMETCNDPEAKAQLSQQINEWCWKYDAELQDWVTTIGALPVAFAESQLTKDRIDCEAPSTEDFALAHLGTLYWTACALLYDALHLTAIDRETLPERLDPRLYVHKVARILPYFQVPSVGEFYLSIVTTPITMCLHVLYDIEPVDQPSEERHMLMRALSRGRGSQVERFILSALRHTRSKDGHANLEKHKQ